eukprot:scaffold120681_cov39-Attheya_sp.AAC.1
MQTKTFNVKTNKVQIVKGHNPQSPKYINREYVAEIRCAVAVTMGLLSRCGPCVDEVTVTMRCHEADAVRMRSLSRCGGCHNEVTPTIRSLSL